MKNRVSSLKSVLMLLFLLVINSAWADEIPSWVSAKIRSSSKYDRLLAIEQLSENLDLQASALLLECSNDQDNTVRAKVYWALAYRMPYINDSAVSQKISQQLLEGAKDKSPDVRKHVTRGLVFVDEKPASPVLIELMNDDSDMVRQQAFISMRVITGVYIANTQSYWKQWYANKDNPKFFKHLEWTAPEVQDSFKKERVFEIINNRDYWVSPPLSPIVDLELSRIGMIGYKELTNFALNSDWVNPEIFGTLKKIDRDLTTRLLKDALKQGKRVPACAKWLGCGDQESYRLLLANYGKGNNLLVNYQVITEISGYKDLERVIDLWNRVIDDAELPNVSVAVKQAGLRYARSKDEREKIKPFLKRALFHKNPRFQEAAINAVRSNKLIDFMADLNELFKADTIEVSRLARQVAEELK